MGLAQVQLQAADFQSLHGHMMASRHRNLHLREANRRGDRLVLRHLHAMYARGPNEIVGMISGPDVFCHYELVLVRGQPQMRVLAEECSAEEADRIQGRFLREALKRVRDERNRPAKLPIRRTPGHFYLKRRTPGSAANDASCVAATSRAVLDRRFVSQLRGWNFELLHWRP